MRRLAVALGFLVFVPAAGAWTTIPGAVDDGVAPSMIVTQAGTVLVSFDSRSSGTISVTRNHGTPTVVVANDPYAGRTQLVQQPNGAVQLYFPDAQGVGRMTSIDDGETWSGPIQTQSHDAGGVESAAIGPDGTPLFTQDGTGFVDVFRGIGGETSANVFTTCCGYDSTVAVDAGGLVQVAFYSNATPNGAFEYEMLGPGLTPTASIPLGPTVEHTPRVPIVSDRSGNTFLAWAPGNPMAIGVTVVPFRGGVPVGDGVTFKAAFSGSDPHMALVVDGSDRLWAVWTGQGKIHVARSRTHGADFGAVVTSPLPGTAYQVSAAALAGSVDVIVNTGSALAEEELDPGLTLRITKAGKKHVVQALDDGFAVSTARFTVAGRTYRANAAGKATVPSGSGSAAAPGYASAAFRIP
ncbi:MAG: hypothetical protein JOY73_10230 [Actinobacteria bacterium]|nr:hypothetical protein [Actinomycetota bacterium]